MIKKYQWYRNTSLLGCFSRNNFSSYTARINLVLMGCYGISLFQKYRRPYGKLSKGLESKYCRSMVRQK